MKVNCKNTELFILFLNWNEWTLTISSIYIIDFRHVWTIKSDLIVKPLLITLPLSRISKHPKTNLAQMVRLHKILIYNEICLKELIKMSNSPIVISWFNIWKDLLIYNIGDASNKARIFCFYTCTQNHQACRESFAFICKFVFDMYLACFKLEIYFYLYLLAFKLLKN